MSEGSLYVVMRVVTMQTLDPMGEDRRYLRVCESREKAERIDDGADVVEIEPRVTPAASEREPG